MHTRAIHVLHYAIHSGAGQQHVMGQHPHVLCGFGCTLQSAVSGAASPGRLLALMGASGAGKSTLVRPATLPPAEPGSSLCRLHRLWLCLA